ncbi:protein adenylyltransferase SelO [Pelagovum pacificum]|uniref:Protein nucleotidyltransferase YdiU n=1 Tax=Pelagovum pacificum TaxID=2588711 RepID=A0A5C5GCE7_9RHOB|nr:YdiU family protein [Pelagovum pacificum]QQA44402.1 YdiU family protein [Pelagovum pacificum]TNY32482.1 YdiU family protein [Pelagovum pacificum]
MTLAIPFDNSYARLPKRFFTALNPTPVTAPEVLAFNTSLAEELGINTGGLTSTELAKLFSGNEIPDGASPLAQVYAGHQFGNWNPQLGDGRAILLGEIATLKGRVDLQLKGSGPTPYSRMGDGRAALGPVIREYVMSEAMDALGIPTTRALAAVLTGDEVYRETTLPGAVLTRVAASHIRVGTFQFFAAREDTEALSALVTHVIERHYPAVKSVPELLEKMMERQARLIALWMSVGFIHGVMNTDNMTISGETIDYGPCAFMDTYHPDTVFSSIDQFGRYAYAQQPQIGVWNVAQFATCLIPLMEDRDAAIRDFTDIVHRFPEVYQAEWLRLFGQKLGLPALEEPTLVEDLLTLMATDGADFTNTFRRLPHEDARDQFIEREKFDEWKVRWQSMSPDTTLMADVNPVVIPRLHRIEEAIQAGQSGDYSKFEKLLKIVVQPYDPNIENSDWTHPPAEDERVTRTFCGT